MVTSCYPPESLEFGYILDRWCLCGQPPWEALGARSLVSFSGRQELDMCGHNLMRQELSTSCVTPLGKDSWILVLDFPGLGTGPVLLCTYPFILTHHSHDCEYMKIPIANHWVWEWSWGPSPTTQSAKIVVFALKRDGTVGITQLLKVSLNYLL